MKKTLLYFSIMMGLALLGYREIYKLAGNAHRDMGYAVIHVSENKPAQQMIKLQEAFEKEGKNISFSIPLGHLTVLINRLSKNGSILLLTN